MKNIRYSPRYPDNIIVKSEKAPSIGFMSSHSNQDNHFFISLRQYAAFPDQKPVGEAQEPKATKILS